MGCSLHLPLRGKALKASLSTSEGLSAAGGRFALAALKGGTWFEGQTFCRRALPCSDQFYKGIFLLGLIASLYFLV